MQISTLVRRFILIFLRRLLPCELSFTFCDFDTVAFLIISSVVIHRMLTLITQAYSGAWSCHGSILQSHDCNIEQSTVTCSAFDNDECHVMAFWPISEVAHSWSYDKMILCVGLEISPSYSTAEQWNSQSLINIFCNVYNTRWYLPTCFKICTPKLSPFCFATP